MRTESLFIPRIKMEKEVDRQQVGKQDWRSTRSTFFRKVLPCLSLAYELNLDLLNPAHLLQDIFFVFGLLGERDTLSESSIDITCLFIVMRLFSSFYSIKNFLEAMV